MKIPKQVSLKHLSIIVISTILLTSFVFYIYADTPSSTFWISSGVYPGAPSYTVWKEGSNYFAKDAYGEIEFSGTNATDVIINSLDGLGQTGGRILVEKGTYVLTTSLTYVLDEAAATPYPIEIIGEGESTVFQYQGAGYAINITTDYLTYEYVLLSSFKINGVSKTTDRHGLAISQIGRNVYVEKIFVTQMDIGIHIYDTNTVFLNGIKVTSCNTGILTQAGSSSSPNAIHITTLKATDNTNYGVLCWGGNSISISAGVIESNGVGVTLNGTWAAKIENSYFEANGLGINITAIDPTYPIFNTEIENCYFSNNTDYAISLFYTRNTLIKNIKSRRHDNATILLYGNTNYDLIIINPSITHPAGSSYEDPYLLDGSPTQVGTRLAGQVITSRWQGVIAMAGEAMHLGTVVYWSAVGTVANATSANTTTSSVIAYKPRAANKPCVVVTSGIAEVYVKSGENIAVGDQLTSSTTSGQAIETTDETPSIYVIGYAVETDADGADLIYTRINS